MMNMLHLYRIVFAAVLFLCTACGKNLIDYGDVTPVTDSDAIVKINYASQYGDDRAIFVKFNDTRVTPLILGRQPYPGGGWNTRGDSRADFLVAKPGVMNMQICLPFRNDNGLDSLVLYQQEFTLEKGKRYTIHVADTAEFTRSIIAEENFLMPDSGYARYRFINLMPDVEAIDLYYGAYSTTAAGQTTIADSLVASNIGYMQLSEEFTLNRSANRTWKIRKAGAPVTNASVLAWYSSTNTTLNQRVYTVYAMGYEKYFGTGDIRRPFVSFYHVR
ncbi:protein of unknown function [Parapedobacter composti]|uniref:Uncharacterized protein n=2 Tax=Parapedobacter composti TaxID=623281 RepID=A0A1I1KPG3_9SPHI|nr:protein of unknown function [Parapedobacter composti]